MFQAFKSIDMGDLIFAAILVSTLYLVCVSGYGDIVEQFTAQEPERTYGGNKIVFTQDPDKFFYGPLYNAAAAPPEITIPDSFAYNHHYTLRDS